MTDSEAALQTNGGTVTQTLDQEVLQFSSRPDATEILAGPLRVADLMTSETTSMRVDQSFSELVTMMANHSFHHVLVIDGDKKLSGVISDRDVLRELARTRQWHSKQLSEIMTQHPVTITPDTLISVAVREMLANRINCLPVVAADGMLCGILTSTDLLKALERLQTLIEKSKRPA
jgi:CBS domain-containing protein